MSALSTENPYRAPEHAAPVNPYAPPRSEPAEGRGGADHELWRDGRWVVCGDRARLPDRCVVCNEPANGRSRTRRFVWHHPAWYLTMVFTFFVFAIVYIVVRRQATIEYGMCRKHHAQSVRARWIGWGGLLVGAGVVYAETGWDETTDPLPTLVGIVVGLFCMLISRRPSNWVRIKRIAKGRAYFRVAPAFAMSIPPKPDFDEF